MSVDRRFIIVVVLLAVAVGAGVGIMGASWLVSQTRKKSESIVAVAIPVSDSREKIVAGEVRQVKYAFGALGWVTLIKLVDLKDASKYYFVATEGWNNDFIIGALMEVAFLDNEDLALSEDIEELLHEGGRVERKTTQVWWKKIVDYKKYRPID